MYLHRLTHQLEATGLSLPPGCAALKSPIPFIFTLSHQVVCRCLAAKRQTPCAGVDRGAAGCHCPQPAGRGGVYLSVAWGRGHPWRSIAVDS